MQNESSFRNSYTEANITIRTSRRMKSSIMEKGHNHLKPKQITFNPPVVKVKKRVNAQINNLF
jgi:hypothetical protein